MGNPWKRPGPTAIPHGKNAASARKGIRARMHLSGNWTHALTGSAVVAAPVCVARIEAEVASVVAAARTLRARPAVAVTADEDEVSVMADAGSGQEDTPAVRTGELATLHTILRCPNALVTLVEKFLDLVERGHLPGAAPLHVSHIILSAADTGTEATTFFLGVIIMFVSLPGVIRLRGGLPPRIVVSMALGFGRPYVAARPFCARGQAEVYHVGMVVVGAV